MNTNSFLDAVLESAGMKTRESAAFATRAVLNSLRGMIAQKTSDHVAEQIPEELWPLGPVECISQLIPTFESYDVYGFLTRVQKEANLDDTGQAEQMSRAVLSVLHKNLDAQTIAMIANDLPGDVRIMWIGASEAVPTRYIAQPRLLPQEEEDLTASSAVLPGMLDLDAYGEIPSNALAAEHYQAEKNLAVEIERLLGVSDDVDASDINVQVMHGEVILRGTVKTERERRSAQQIVSDTLQSTVVRNEIHVED